MEDLHTMETHSGAVAELIRTAKCMYCGKTKAEHKGIIEPGKKVPAVACLDNQARFRATIRYDKGVEPKKEILDSNALKTTINNVCSECGIEANRLTCLKRYGAEPKQKCFLVSTYHTGICDFCKREKPITQTRDFFYPDFNLMKK